MELEIFGLDGVQYFLPPDPPYFKIFQGQVKFYSNIKYFDLDDSYVFLPEIFENKLYPSGIELFMTNTIPIFFSGSGISSEVPISKKDLESVLRKLMRELRGIPEGNVFIHKYLLLNDIFALTDSLFTRLADVKKMFDDFYVELYRIDMLVEFSPYSDYEDSVYRQSGASTVRLFSLLENLIIKLSSLLDIITKIFFEYFAEYDDFENYPRMKSTNKQYYNYNEFKHRIDTHNTIFEKNKTLTLLETLRNEIVHNGALDYHNILWVRIEQMQIVEKYILLPDIADGKFESFNNRKRFYSQENKLNYILPGLIAHFYFLVDNTLQIILKDNN